MCTVDGVQLPKDERMTKRNDTFDKGHGDDAVPPFVLVAPNGARRGPADHSEVPVTVEQIVATARDCHRAGARGLHLHVRDNRGQHSLDAGRYLETLAELKRVVPRMVVQITTEAAGLFDVNAQIQCLRDVTPKWASISVREIARQPELAPRVYALCADQGTRVQHILYDADDAALLARWRNEGIVAPSQNERLLVLGRYTDNQQSSPSDLDRFPMDVSPWMVCAFGSQEHVCLHEAARRGADVRVGFENSFIGPDGQNWSDNAASVAALVARIGRKPE